MNKLMLWAFVLWTGVNAFAQQDFLKISYGKQEQQLFDLFLPKKYDSATPLVIFIHGGAWIMGDRYYTDSHAKKLRDRGFVVANLEYRYAGPKVHWEDLEQDIRDAVNKLSETAAHKGFRKDGYHFVGISAGAHLSLMHAYSFPGQVASVTSISGPSGLADPGFVRLLIAHDRGLPLRYLSGKDFGSEAEAVTVLKEISPYDRIREVPTLLIHGDQDPLVPYEQSVALYKALQSRNIPTELITVPGAQHDAGMGVEKSETKNLDAIAVWIRKYDQRLSR